MGCICGLDSTYGRIPPGATHQSLPQGWQVLPVVLPALPVVQPSCDLLDYMQFSPVWQAACSGDHCTAQASGFLGGVRCDISYLPGVFVHHISLSAYLMPSDIGWCSCSLISILHNVPSPVCVSLCVMSTVTMNVLCSQASSRQAATTSGSNSRSIRVNIKLCWQPGHPESPLPGQPPLDPSMVHSLGAVLAVAVPACMANAKKKVRKYHFLPKY